SKESSRRQRRPETTRVPGLSFRPASPSVVKQVKKLAPLLSDEQMVAVSSSAKRTDSRSLLNHVRQPITEIEALIPRGSQDREPAPRTENVLHFAQSVSAGGETVLPHENESISTFSLQQFFATEVRLTPSATKPRRKRWPI